MSKITVFTIGFTKKSAEKFFSTLCENSIKRVIDVRLNNVSQLAGFSKKDDLRYFLKRICTIDYIHKIELAPTKEILNEYKKNKGKWSTYEDKFYNLMSERKIEETLSRALLDGACLLCSEDKPDHCHRRLVVEYLEKKWGDIKIVHLS
jgi:uncharacterized protein (DUF488 family)